MGQDETLSTDEALAEINSIIDRLDAMGPGDPGRADLIARRDQLRRSARQAAVASRSTDTLLYERDQARRRLVEIDSRNAKKVKAEKRVLSWIIDPGSEANRIDRMLQEKDEAEREDLERRIEEIQIELDDTDRT